MKQYEAVIETLDKLGGVATLGDLNSEVFKIQECEWKTKTPFASIRRIVQQTKGIYKIKPGLYGLENKTKKEELFLKQKRTKTPKYRDRSITLTIKAYW